MLKRIREYMLGEVEEHIDPRTGEVNCTGLAEATMWFGFPGWEEDGWDESDFFEVAFEVSQEVEGNG